MSRSRVTFALRSRPTRQWSSCAAGPSRSTYAVSTAGAVRSAGFTLLPTYEAPHYDLLLATGQYPEAERLLSLFSSPEPNMYKRRGR